jgi:alkylated DNA repair dioxygenase AlkB
VARRHQDSLLAPPLPVGFLYRPEFVTRAEEQQLVADIARLEFTRVEMRGAVARRRMYVSPKDQRGLAPRRATHEIELEPRSGYLITGEARRDFEHSIPAVASLRYSITFRTLRQ